MKFFKKSLLFLTLISLIFFSGSIVINAQEDQIEDDYYGGVLRVMGQEGDIQEFPLKHTDVKAEISGYISRVELKQEFTNPYDKPIEAVYIFPMPSLDFPDQQAFLCQAQLPPHRHWFRTTMFDLSGVPYV